jgi:hypothetical protein
MQFSGEKEAPNRLPIAACLAYQKHGEHFALLRPTNTNIHREPESTRIDPRDWKRKHFCPCDEDQEASQQAPKNAVWASPDTYGGGGIC